MPSAVFESFHRNIPGWSAYFPEPLVVYQANELPEVIPVLREAEKASEKSLWAVVLLSYEASQVFDPALQTNAPAGLPLAWVAIFDKIERPPLTLNQQATHSPHMDWKPLITAETYTSAISKIQNHIASGDTYQVNYTFPLHSTFQGDSWAWYRQLGTNQGAAYSAFIDMGAYQVLSFSPELFFEKQGTTLSTRPMKGTLGRGRWFQEDEFQALKLSSSPKNRAENIMIVDLLRNDLGRISIPGTVQVPSLCQVERYPTLLQMTSTVEASVPESLSLLQILESLFPCGSVTGAPKIRTMQIIREIEPYPRSIYTGTIGIVFPGGDCVFNVAIRTIWLEKSTSEVRMGVGGGITIDSQPEEEYAECLLKSRFLNRRWPEFQLLETLRLESGSYFLLSRHLFRMRESAIYFGYDWDETRIWDELEHVKRGHPEGYWRIRLLAESNGTIRLEVFPLPASPPFPLVVALAPQPVDIHDPFLYNKTTHREIYETQLAARPDCDDLIFWNEREEVTESSIANIVVEIDGVKWTPPRSSGLLAGTFRNELIEQGILQERVLSKAELKQSGNLYLINSVRKWIPVRLKI
ncbi:MAG: aminodeoxychorismate synthase component I [Terriglobia bacterium]